MNIKDIYKSIFNTKRSFSILGKDLFHNINSTKLSDGKSQLAVYTNSLYVYSCVRVRAKKVSQLLDFKLKNKNSDKDIEESKLLDVLNSPNTYQTKEEFFECYQTYKDITGSVFIYVIRKGDDNDGDIQEMHLLKPDCIKIILDKEQTKIVGFESTDPALNKKKFNPNEIIFSLSPNPISPLSGLSPLLAGAFTITTEKQLCEYQSNVLKNGGKVEGIFTFETDRITKEQVEEMKERYKEDYAEAKRSGLPLFMGGKSKFDNLGLTPTELSYLESKKINRDDVLVLYSVPKTLLGLTDGVQKGNYAETERMFIKDIIYPEIKNLVAKLNTLSKEEELLYSPDPTPEDTEDINNKIESGGTYHYMTINEMRELQSLEPIPEGDIILVPFSLVELGKEEVLPKE